MHSKTGKTVRSGRLLLTLALLLVANSAYLAAFGSPDYFYVANGLLHPLLGIIVAILFIIFLTRHREVFRGRIGTLAWILLGLSAAYGVYLMIVGMTRPHSLALYAHVSFAIAGLFVLFIVFRSHIRRTADPGDWRRAWRCVFPPAARAMASRAPAFPAGWMYHLARGMA